MKLRQWRIKLNPEYSKIVILFLSWRLALFLVAYLGFQSLPHFSGVTLAPDLHPALAMWLPYDSNWFIQIAKEGYAFNAHAAVFFPVWPLLIRFFSYIFFFLDTRTVAFILANIITLFDCLIFYRLVKEDYDEAVAYRSVKYFLFFPMSLFLATAYSEPVFLLMVLLSFLYLRRQKFFRGSLAALVASATRLVGAVLFIPFVVEIIQNRKIKQIFLALLVPAGLALYLVYLKVTLNDPLGFLHAYQNSDWSRGLNGAAFSLLWQDFRTLFSLHLFGGSYVGALLTTGLWLLFGFILIVGVRKIRLSYVLYGLGVILLPLVSGSLISINRYILAAFPVFIILGLWGKKPWQDELITVSSLLLLGLFTVMFVTGWWVG